MAYTASTTAPSWCYWIQVSSTTTASATVTWFYWNQAATSGTTVCIQPAWTTWNTGYEETAGQKQAREEAAAAYREQAEREQAGWRAREAERQEELVRATARAEELLLSLLSGRQAADYREHGWFEVRGSRGGRWRIRNRGQSGNVDLMPEIGNERDASYCAHPPGGLPAPDAHLAQMLALVTDEDQFLKVANRSYARPARQAA